MLEAIAALVIAAMIVLLAWDASNGNVLRWGRIGGVVAFVLLVFWIGLNCGSAFAQHVHPDETITDPKVAQFYDGWRRPPQRAISCCSSKDCYAAPIRPRLNGGVEYFHKWTQTWARIPESVMEHNQPDAHGSPNHEAHICAAPYAPDLVFCAVLGGGA